jgi:uncharacterized lipoprotein YmbA
MKKGILQLRTFTLVVVAFWLAGCASSPPARFYTLNPLGPQEAKHSSPAAANSVSVSIAPVEIPDYLERPQIVTRDGRNGLHLSEFDRWGGSLSDNIAAVMAENLGQLLGSDRVFAYPRMRAEKADYLVSMRVLRLDCVLGDQVLLKAQWTLLGPDRKDVATHVATFTERLNDKGYETMVAAVGRTLEQVSREIAREIPAQK